MVKLLVKTRRLVETVIGQLSERFHLQTVRSWDLWHFTNRINRKILAHTLAFWINRHSISVLIRGESRLMAAIVTRIKTFTATDLATADLVAWRKQRSQLQLLKEKRLQQRRFRRDPADYLLKLETQLIQSILLP